jgi:hypothetical protein
MPTLPALWGAPSLRFLQGRVFRLQAESEFAPMLTVSQNIAVGSIVPALREIREERGTQFVVVPCDWKAGATLYNRVGVVKGHVDPREVLTFLFVEGFGFAVALAVALLMRPRPAFRILRWSLVPPTIYPVADVRP